MSIGEKIKKAREGKKMSQMKLAEYMGVSQKDISRWENGERVPAFDNLKRLCMELRISADYLMDINYNDVRYIVVEEDIGADEYLTVFETLGQANEEAKYKWEQLTKKEKERMRVYVIEVNRDDLADEESWTSYESSKDPQGAFDSDEINSNI